ncbi:hypothetical protein HYX07_02560 [Candidatus Woesearchaeota archaeon]|nr:hypothetical protein [Candidatus Woesearchaeota archaeon]
MNEKTVYVTRFVFAPSARLQDYIRIPELEIPVSELYLPFDPRRRLTEASEALLVYKPYKQRDALFSFLWYLNGRKDPRLRGLGSVFRLASEFTPTELAVYLKRNEDVKRLKLNVVLAGENLTSRIFHEIRALKYNPVLV